MSSVRSVRNSVIRAGGGRGGDPAGDEGRRMRQLAAEDRAHLVGLAAHGQGRHVVVDQAAGGGGVDHAVGRPAAASRATCPVPSM